MANVNVLDDFPDTGLPEVDDIIYVIRGTGTSRDKQMKMNPFIFKGEDVPNTRAINLSSLKTNMNYRLTPGVTLILSGALAVNLLVRIIWIQPQTGTPPEVTYDSKTYFLKQGGSLEFIGVAGANPEIIQGDGDNSMTSTTLTNFNSHTTVGFASMGANPTNKPPLDIDGTVTNWFSEIVGDKTGTVFQRAIGFVDTNKIVEYSRSVTGNLYTIWEAIGYSDLGKKKTDNELDTMKDGYTLGVYSADLNGIPAGSYVVSQISVFDILAGVNGSYFRVQNAQVRNTSPTGIVYTRIGTRTTGNTTYIWGDWIQVGSISGAWTDLGIATTITGLLNKTGFGYISVSETTDFPWPSGMATFEVSTARIGNSVQTILRVYRFDSNSDRVQLYTSIATTTATDLLTLVLDAPFQENQQNGNIDDKARIGFYFWDSGTGGTGTAPGSSPTGFMVQAFTGLGTEVFQNAFTSNGLIFTRRWSASSTNWSAWVQVAGYVERAVDTYTSVSTITPNSEVFKQLNVTALSGSLVITAPSSIQSTDALTFIYRIKDDGVTPRSLTWNNFTEIGVTLPSTTTLNKTLYVGTIYNLSTLSWDVVAFTEQS